MEKIIQYRQESARLTKQLRDRVDAIEVEKRDITSEDKTYMDNIESRLTELDDLIAREERLISREKNIAEVGIAKTESKEPTENRDELIEKEMRSYLTNKDYQVSPEVRAFQSGTDGNGNLILPETFEKTIWQKLRDFSQIRQYATILPMTAHKNTIPMSGIVSPAEYVAEAGTYPIGSDTLNGKVLHSYKIGKMLKVPEELLNSGINVEQYILNQVATAFDMLLGSEFINGTTNVLGILPDATLGTTAASATAITYDEILDLFYSQTNSAYRQKSTWVLPTSAMKVIRQLKDGNGAYIFTPATGSAPGTIEGRPVLIDNNLPAMTTGNKAILFGDLSQYVIGDRKGITVRKLDELYAHEGQVGFRFDMYTGARLLDGDAVKYLQMA